MNAAEIPSPRKTPLPDLDTLDLQSLKALVLTQQAELDSRTTEIESLKLGLSPFRGHGGALNAPIHILSPRPTKLDFLPADKGSQMNEYDS